MRSVQRVVYLSLAVLGLWQCLVSASPAVGDEIPFYASNQNTSETFFILCNGPWGRQSPRGPLEGRVDFGPGANKVKFYAAEINAFSPFGDWNCAYFKPLPGPRTQFISRVDFCLARKATEVHLIIPPNRGPLQIITEQCPPQGALPPPALVRLSGSATGVGESEEDQATLTLKGKFNVSTPLALDQATVTVEALLHEVEGAGELLSGLPLGLTAKPGSTADEATFRSEPHTQPRVRLDIHQRANQPAEFKLKLEQGSIPQFPQHCAPEEDPTTALALRFTIEDGVNLPLVVEGEVAWACKGEDPQEPETLKVQGLLPIDPTPRP
jgi:hypothetical protein